MRILHTPESRFSELKDYPFQARYLNINGIQMHYVDEGPASHASPVLLLHGVPAWSYLYRHLIKAIAENGSRVIAPDLIGFGKSDKPEDLRFHTYHNHVEYIARLINVLNLKNILLFGHDWGSLIGLRIAAAFPVLFSGIIISNGMLPTGEHKIHSFFKLWKLFAKYSPILPVDLIIQAGVLKKLDQEEKRAYRAPFPSSRYKTAIRALPGLVPSSPADPDSTVNRIAWKSLEKLERPFLTVFSNSDPITRGGDKYLQKRIPGANGQDHVRFDTRHFIQEDRSKELTEIILKFKQKTESAL